jgi:short subunit fatty acids transporter
MNKIDTENQLVIFAIRCANWAECWFPDLWVFAASTLAIVALAAMLIGAPPVQITNAFGNGFWVAPLITSHQSLNSSNYIHYRHD